MDPDEVVPSRPVACPAAGPGPALLAAPEVILEIVEDEGLPILEGMPVGQEAASRSALLGVPARVGGDGLSFPRSTAPGHQRA